MLSLLLRGLRGPAQRSPGKPTQGPPCLGKKQSQLRPPHRAGHLVQPQWGVLPAGIGRGSGTPSLASSHAQVAEVVWGPSTADVMSETSGTRPVSYLLPGTGSCHNPGKDRAGPGPPASVSFAGATGEKQPSFLKGPPSQPPAPQRQESVGFLREGRV